MAKINHIAIATPDAEKTARFYKEVFDLKEASKIDGANASGYYLTDGNVNLAILDFKNDQVTGPLASSGHPHAQAGKVDSMIMEGATTAPSELSVGGQLPPINPANM